MRALQSTSTCDKSRKIIAVDIVIRSNDARILSAVHGVTFYGAVSDMLLKIP